MKKFNKANFYKNLELIKVDYLNDLHVNLLYDFLKKRKFNISHKNIPTYEDHLEFVKNNPYRKWFLISHEFKIKGSIYILYDNGIGIDIAPSNYYLVDKILSLVFLENNPLRAMPSIRTNNFHINISPDNHELNSFITKAGGILKQQTFEFGES